MAAPRTLRENPNMKSRGEGEELDQQTAPGCTFHTGVPLNLPVAFQPASCITGEGVIGMLRSRDKWDPHVRCYRMKEGTHPVPPIAGVVAVGITCEIVHNAGETRRSSRPIYHGF